MDHIKMYQNIYLRNSPNSNHRSYNFLLMKLLRSLKIARRLLLRKSPIKSLKYIKRRRYPWILKMSKNVFTIQSISCRLLTSSIRIKVSYHLNTMASANSIHSRSKLIRTTRNNWSPTNFRSQMKRIQKLSIISSNCS